ncbi:MAG: hypothetical protein DRO12_00005 [Thermoprotei archaeon]|nr:MAG: hypothetical protein DRO12_00005 [Thermoprotei archaeon]
MSLSPSLRKGINELVITLIMLGVAIALGVGFWAWSSGFLGGALSQSSIAVNGIGQVIGDYAIVTLKIRNLGSVKVNIDVDGIMLKDSQRNPMNYEIISGDSGVITLLPGQEVQLVLQIEGSDIVPGSKIVAVVTGVDSNGNTVSASTAITLFG